MLSGVEIGLAVPPVADGSRFREQAIAAERAGTAALWTYDHGRGDEALSRAGYLAAVTERVLVCSGVINPFTRHPAVIASASSTLARLSGGRLRLVMGLGWSPWVEGILGVRRQRPLAGLRDGVVAVKRLLAGGCRSRARTSP